jgi:serine/threonine protein phosphatase PrpC
MQYEIGRVSLLGNRETNQDRLGIAESHAGVVLILADGLGGMPGGALAAETLVKFVQHELQHEVMPVDVPEKFLGKLIIKAHYAVRAVGQKQDPKIEPGTTAVICLVQNKKAWWAHVGDSRCYLFRDGLPIYRTKDDSYVEHLYQKGEIPIEEIEGHPMRNYVTQCIGVMPNEPRVSVSKGVELEKGDILLLCTDGFWEPLDDALIGSQLLEKTIQQSISELALQAEKTNYPNSDNTSVLAIKITSLQDTQKTTRKKNTKSSAPETPLDGAIQEIEDTFNFYKDEMDK